MTNVAAATTDAAGSVLDVSWTGTYPAITHEPGNLGTAQPSITLSSAVFSAANVTMTVTLTPSTSIPIGGTVQIQLFGSGIALQTPLYSSELGQYANVSFISPSDAAGGATLSNNYYSYELRVTVFSGVFTANSAIMFTISGFTNPTAPQAARSDIHAATFRSANGWQLLDQSRTGTYPAIGIPSSPSAAITQNNNIFFSIALSSFIAAATFVTMNVTLTPSTSIPIGGTVQIQLYGSGMALLTDQSSNEWPRTTPNVNFSSPFNATGKASLQQTYQDFFLLTVTLLSGNFNANSTIMFSISGFTNPTAPQAARSDIYAATFRSVNGGPPLDQSWTGTYPAIVLPANNYGNVTVTQYTDAACKNQMSPISGQSNPSFYVLNSCTPVAGGENSFRLKVTCLNGFVYSSVYADSGCTDAFKISGGDQGYPTDVCVQQAGGSLLVKSDNCSSIPAFPPPIASPPPISTAFNTIVTVYTDSACKNSTPTSASQQNPSVYVSNVCTPMSGGGGFVKFTSCVGGNIVYSVYSDAACANNIADSGHPNDVCVQQAGGSLLLKSDNCSSIPASPPPISTAFNTIVTVYTDSACKNSTPTSASQHNPSVYVSNVCTPVSGGGGSVKFTSCVGGKIVYSIYSDAACANKLADSVSDTNKCTDGHVIFDCSFNPTSNSAEAPNTTAALQEIDVERNWFLLSFRTRHLCSEQRVRSRDCLLKNASFPAGKLNCWLLLTPANVVFNFSVA
jgi:hypothetical protein